MTYFAAALLGFGVVAGPANALQYLRSGSTPHLWLATAGFISIGIGFAVYLPTLTGAA